MDNDHVDNRFREGAGLLYELLPFSAAPSTDAIHQTALDLASILELPPRISCLSSPVHHALAAESRFRQSWWSGRADPLRDALHRAKANAHRVPGKTAALSEAWMHMGTHVHGSLWRNHVRQLCVGRGETERKYLRRAIRAAQQLWTRAARWDAAFASDSNPFLSVIQLVVHSVWPIGFHNGTVQLLHANMTDGDCVPEVKGEPLAFQPQSPSDPRGLFLSGPFTDDLTIAALTTLRRRNIAVIHGRVDETTPPEQQLGNRIMASSSCIGVLSRYDGDFGLPWWTFQELDFAAACGRPVAVIHTEGIAGKLNGN